MKFPLPVSIFLVLLACGAALPARGDGGDPAPDSKWQPTQGRSPEGSFSKADQIILNQVATQGRLEQLCRNLQLSGSVSQSFPSSDGGVSLGVLRRLVTLPSVENPQNLELYQVDEYAPGASLTPTLNFARRTDASLGLGIGASFTLDSTVVRPRAFFKNCEEVKDLLNLADVKFVLPPTLLKHPTNLTRDEFVSVMAPRISAMEDGELWSLSGVTTISAAPAAGFTAGQLSAGVSIGGTQNGGAVMIVHRLSRTRTRFSLRVNHLQVFNAQGTVADVPIINIFNPSGALTLKNELEKVFNGSVASKLVDYFTASFTALQQVGSQSTQQYLLVYDVDTSDPAQVAELAELMQSDFLELIKKAASMATLHASQKATLDNFNQLTREHDAVFDRVADLLQTDVGLIDHDHSVTLKLPILGSHNRASSASRDQVVTVDASGAGGPSTRELHLATADRPKNDVGFSIPVINKTVFSDTSDTKFTGFYFADDGRVQAVYSHIDAFQRRGAASVQTTLDQFRDMLALVGSRGNPAADGKAAQYQINLPSHDGGTLKSGSLSFTLSIDAAGIEKAFHASADEIRRSAERIFPIPLAVGDDGKPQNNYNKMIVDQIVKVLTQGRDQTPAQRSDALRDLMVEESNNNVVIDSLGSFFSFLPFTQSHELAYEGTMKVILQLADPQDVSANLAYKVDAGVKHAKNPEINISVNQSATNTDLLDAGRANRVRTQQPQYMDVNQ
jgi:hypothetical protein